MNRSSSGDKAKNRAKKLAQPRILQFGNHKVRLIVDDRGKFWFCLREIKEALEIKEVADDVHQYCVSNEMILPLAGVEIRDRDCLNLSATTMFITFKGIQKIERSAARPKSEQYIESIVELLVHEVPDDNSARESEELRREIRQQGEELARQAEEIKRLELEVTLARQIEEERLSASAAGPAAEESEAESARPDENEEKKILATGLKNLKPRVPTEVVYIATSPSYAADNIFKVGGVNSWDRLKYRRRGLNNARRSDELLYICRTVECSNHNRLEQRIKDMVGDHRLKVETGLGEMYQIHYDDLEAIVEYQSDRLKEEDEMFNASYERFARNLTQKSPAQVPEEVRNGADYRRLMMEGENRAASVSETNWDSLGNEEQKAVFVEKELDQYVQSLALASPPTSDNPLTVKRADFEDYLSRTAGVNFTNRKRQLRAALTQATATNDKVIISTKKK